LRITADLFRDFGLRREANEAALRRTLLNNQSKSWKLKTASFEATFASSVMKRRAKLMRTS